MKNKLVDLLATYGPSAASSSLFDEHVRAEVKKHGIKEFEIPPAEAEERYYAMLEEPAMAA
jgi:hypothetical protein